MVRWRLQTHFTILRFKNDFGIIEMLQISDFFEEATPDLNNLISVQFLKSTIATFSMIFNDFQTL